MHHPLIADLAACTAECPTFVKSGLPGLPIFSNNPPSGPRQSILLYPPVSGVHSLSAGCFTDRNILPHEMPQFWDQPPITLVGVVLMPEHIYAGARKRLVVSDAHQNNGQIHRGARIATRYQDLNSETFRFFAIYTQDTISYQSYIRVCLYTKSAWRVPDADFILQIPEHRNDVEYPLLLAHRAAALTREHTCRAWHPEIKRRAELDMNGTKDSEGEDEV